MTKAVIQKKAISYTFVEPYWDVTVSNHGTEIVRKAFCLGVDKSSMIDWATQAGAEEVTFKL